MKEFNLYFTMKNLCKFFKNGYQYNRDVHEKDYSASRYRKSRGRNRREQLENY